MYTDFTPSTLSSYRKTIFNNVSNKITTVIYLHHYKLDDVNLSWS